jgi:hypothetical protein
MTTSRRSSPTTPTYKKVPQIIADQISLRFRSNRANASSPLAQRILFQQTSLSGSNQFVPVDLLDHATEREEQDFCLGQRGLEVDLRGKTVTFAVSDTLHPARLTVPVSWLQYFKHSSNSTRYLMITSRCECKTAKATNCSNESEQ